MPTPSKFTSGRRRVLLAALGAGSSRRTACTIAGIAPRTLRRWLAQGSKGSPGGRCRVFHDQVLEAEANPRLRPWPLDEPPVDIGAAWRFLERNEFAAKPVDSVAPEPPMTIHVSFQDGEPIAPPLGVS